MKKDRAFRKEKIPPAKGYQALQIIPEHLELEIGCGVGWHPIAHVKKHPEISMIAIEHSKARFALFERRLQKHPELKRLMAVHADAESYVSHCLPSSCLDKIWILYPNPYPKRSQANKRFHNMPFFKELLDKWKIGGEWILRSNELFYIEEARQVFESLKEFQVSVSIRNLKISEHRPETHFERKYLMAGQPCWELKAQKLL